MAAPADALSPFAELPRGTAVAVVVADEVVALAAAATTAVLPIEEAAAPLRALERAVRPRWMWWSARETAAPLLAAGADAPAICWDIAAAHRLLAGGWRDTPDVAWAHLHGLDPAGAPRAGQLDLLAADAVGDADGGDPEDPVRADGYLRLGWCAGSWRQQPARAVLWAQLVLRAAELQAARLGALDVSGSALATAHAESAAELIAVELGRTGLPLDRGVAERVLEQHTGRRPCDASDAAALAYERDHRVLRHLRDGDPEADLRSPAQVKEMLRRAGIDVPDTRSRRLEPYAETSPLVAALLEWRVAERYATTYGYDWLDRHLGTDGRLRGQWGGSDGGAGRMTAQAGMHNLPAPLRAAVRAEPGHILVRADLGQVEPRVLAAASGDRGLATAAEADDLYLPVAERLGVDRKIAKVAVLAAMYGQTSGAAGAALEQMTAAYPVALRFLKAAEQAGRDNRSIRTYGGRLVRLGPLDPQLSGEARRSVVAGRGRFLRNAAVQGAAAEFFKAWVATVRTHLRGRGELVMCLHDELLVHARADVADEVCELVRRDLDVTGARWFPNARVRFVADIAALDCWADAKE